MSPQSFRAGEAVCSGKVSRDDALLETQVDQKDIPPLGILPYGQIGILRHFRHRYAEFLQLVPEIVPEQLPGSPATPIYAADPFPTLWRVIAGAPR